MKNAKFYFQIFLIVIGLLLIFLGQDVLPFFNNYFASSVLPIIFFCVGIVLILISTLLIKKDE